MSLRLEAHNSGSRSIVVEVLSREMVEGQVTVTVVYPDGSSSSQSENFRNNGSVAWSYAAVCRFFSDADLSFGKEHIITALVNGQTLREEIFPSCPKPSSSGQSETSQAAMLTS